MIIRLTGKVKVEAIVDELLYTKKLIKIPLSTLLKLIMPEANTLTLSNRDTIKQLISF